jgi:hypothetical protein
MVLTFPHFKAAYPIISLKLSILIRTVSFQIKILHQETTLYHRWFFQIRFEGLFPCPGLSSSLRGSPWWHQLRKSEKHKTVLEKVTTHRNRNPPLLMQPEGFGNNLKHQLINLNM